MDASTLPHLKHIRGYHGEVGRSMSGRNVRDCIWTACLQALNRKACPIAIKPVIDRLNPQSKAVIKCLRNQRRFKVTSGEHSK
ncbi:hypothetical protein D3C71_1539620 [compost metagenome]